MTLIWEEAAIRRARWIAWWYLAIGLGFLLLGLRLLLVGAPTWHAALRLAVAAGFLLLAYAQFRQGGGRD